jgi:hypothetical protein
MARQSVLGGKRFQAIENRVVPTQTTRYNRGDCNGRCDGLEKDKGKVGTIEALQFIGTGIHAACYRARFVVSDPAQVGDLTLRLVYRGGVQALVNGKEVGRGHLSAGALAADTPGADYPVEAYQEGAQRDRILGPLRVPANLPVKGTNVLAIEIRASLLPPIVLKRELSRSWNALHDRESNWRHGFLARLELQASASVASGLRRPAGLQVWVPDIHHRVASTEFLPPGEPPGAVRTVGARNGTYAAQVADGSLAFDYTVLDRYLDLAVREMGTPRLINFAVMHGNTGAGAAAIPAEVNVWGKGAARAIPLNVSLLGGNKAEAERAWTAFALSLHDHTKTTGLDKAMHFGYPHDREEDPDLRVLLARVTPEVRWTAGPHQAGWQGFATPQYDVVGTVRYFGSHQYAAFRPDMGWKAPAAHLTIPRIDSSVQSLHTASHPFGYRALVNHSLALGRAGFCRVGADEWAAIHYDGMRIPTWIVGMPVLFTLWPGPDGAESSARFEVLLEGIQEGEARIFLEQALDRRLVTGELQQRVEKTLLNHYQETCFFQNKLCIFELVPFNRFSRSLK